MNKIKKQNIAYRQPYICKKNLLSANCYGLKSSTCFKTILVFFSLVVLVCIDIIKNIYFKFNYYFDKKFKRKAHDCTVNS